MVAPSDPLIIFYPCYFKQLLLAGGSCRIPEGSLAGRPGPVSTWKQSLVQPRGAGGFPKEKCAQA